MAWYETGIQLRYGDADAHGHINNVNFYRFMEQARINMILSRDIAAEKDVSILLPYVVAHSECDFHAPVFFTERLIVRIGNLPPRSPTSSTISQLYEVCQNFDNGFPIFSPSCMPVLRSPRSPPSIWWLLEKSPSLGTITLRVIQRQSPLESKSIWLVIK
ncbi:hypothetical protein PAPYR_4437 [Paratrimastix pyriformis]|uniref:Thioesterase n=1 Tax=Paratrimastix pyriformis TaxID=342808 RepID=A0ABQ8UMJ4_9EUKA|nr:hypothetical protein PAPYR_4437 [Paratrimastix pyriformis]